MLDNITFILLNTSHPGNIGAAARAMKNMRLSQLALVKPKHYPSAEATARSSGADDLLTSATVYPDISSAIAKHQIIFAASARERRIPWPTLELREAAELAIKNSQQSIAFIFGHERSGLSNEELDVSHYLVKIPANPEYHSLNLAAAVQVFAYELMMAAKTEKKLAPPQELVNLGDMENFYQYLETLMIEIGFLDPKNPKYLMRRLRRIFNRSQLENMELNILRGLLSQLHRHNKK